MGGGLLGGDLQKLVDHEKTSWSIPHKLNYIPALRDRQIQLIQNFGPHLRLCFDNRTIFNYSYQHWWITDGRWIIEYGGDDTKQAGVNVHCNPRNNYTIDTEFDCTHEVLERMRKVCGATNYSMALRNCEHLARYIHCGAWICFQMVGNGILKKYFFEKMASHTKMINTIPEELKPQEMASVAIYPNDQVSRYSHRIKFIQRKDALTKFDETAYNVVVLGPTGAGKSTLINNLFNLTVCESGGSAMSVTKQVRFYRGQYAWRCEGQKYTNNVNIIDTLGFCDSVMSASDVYESIRSSIKVNLAYIDKVVIVCSGRLEGAHAAAIKQIMAWLSFVDYRNKFVFVYNKADQMNQQERMNSLLHMCSTFGADASQTSHIRRRNGEFRAIKMNLTTGFPPGATFEQIKEDYVALTRAVLCKGGDISRPARIPVDKQSCNIL